MIWGYHYLRKHPNGRKCSWITGAIRCANRAEQMRKRWPFCLPNSEQMSNKVGVVRTNQGLKFHPTYRNYNLGYILFFLLGFFFLVKSPWVVGLFFSEMAPFTRHFLLFLVDVVFLFAINKSLSNHIFCGSFTFSNHLVQPVFCFFLWWEKKRHFAWGYLCKNTCQMPKQTSIPDVLGDGFFS